MNRRSPVLVALVASLALTAAPLRAADLGDAQPAPSAAADSSDFDSRLLVAGLGAIAGTVAFNLAVGGFGALPFLYEAGAATSGAVTTTATGAVAASRVYAVSSGVGGALLASYAFRNRTPQEAPAAPVLSRRLAERVSPR